MLTSADKSKTDCFQLFGLEALARVNQHLLNKTYWNEDKKLVSKKTFKRVKKESDRLSYDDKVY